MKGLARTVIFAAPVAVAWSGYVALASIPKSIAPFAPIPAFAADYSIARIEIETDGLARFDGRAPARSEIAIASRGAGTLGRTMADDGGRWHATVRLASVSGGHAFEIYPVDGSRPASQIAPPVHITVPDGYDKTLTIELKVAQSAEPKPPGRIGDDASRVFDRFIRTQSDTPAASGNAPAGKPADDGDGNVLKPAIDWFEQSRKRYQEDVVPRLSTGGGFDKPKPGAGLQSPSGLALPSAEEVTAGFRSWLERALKGYQGQIVPRLSGGVPETAVTEAEKRAEEARKRAADRIKETEEQRRRRLAAEAEARRRAIEAARREREEQQRLAAERARQEAAARAAEAERLRREEEEARTAEANRTPATIPPVSPTPPSAGASPGSAPLPPDPTRRDTAGENGTPTRTTPETSRADAEQRQRDRLAREAQERAERERREAEQRAAEARSRAEREAEERAALQRQRADQAVAARRAEELRQREAAAKAEQERLAVERARQAERDRSRLLAEWRELGMRASAAAREVGEINTRIGSDRERADLAYRQLRDQQAALGSDVVEARRAIARAPDETARLERVRIADEAERRLEGIRRSVETARQTSQTMSRLASRATAEDQRARSAAREAETAITALFGELSETRTRQEVARLTRAVERAEAALQRARDIVRDVPDIRQVAALPSLPSTRSEPRDGDRSRTSSKVATSRPVPAGSAQDGRSEPRSPSGRDSDIGDERNGQRAAGRAETRGEDNRDTASSGSNRRVGRIAARVRTARSERVRNRSRARGRVAADRRTYSCRRAGRRVRLPGRYVVARGDSLWRIARRHYGKGIRYWRIYRANRRKIRNPNLIYPCQRFRMPK